MRVSEPFSPLIVAFMAFTSTSDKQYRVYSSKEKFTVVDADTAYEAIAASGIENPYKLIHIIPNMESILKESQLKVLKQPLETLESDTEASAEHVEPAETAIAEAPPVEQASVEQPPVDEVHPARE